MGAQGGDATYEVIQSNTLTVAFRDIVENPKEYVRNLVVSDFSRNALAEFLTMNPGTEVLSMIVSYLNERMLVSSDRLIFNGQCNPTESFIDLVNINTMDLLSSSGLVNIIYERNGEALAEDALLAEIAPVFLLAENSEEFKELAVACLEIE